MSETQYIEPTAEEIHFTLHNDLEANLAASLLPAKISLSNDAGSKRLCFTDNNGVFCKTALFGEVPAHDLLSHTNIPLTWAPSAHNLLDHDNVPLTWAPSAHGHAWADILKTGSNLTDLATRQHSGLTNIGVDDHHNQIHPLVSGDHTYSGLTVGQVLRATGETAAAFGALQSSDIPNLGGDPSVEIGLVAQNGDVVTYLRTNGAPALSQAIAPTWTGTHRFTANAEIYSASSNPILSLIAAHDSSYSPMVQFFADATPVIKYSAGYDPANTRFVITPQNTVTGKTKGLWTNASGLSGAFLSDLAARTDTTFTISSGSRTNISWNNFYTGGEFYRTATGTSNVSGWYNYMWYQNYSGITDSGSLATVRNQIALYIAGTYSGTIDGFNTSMTKYHAGSIAALNMFRTVFNVTAGSVTTLTGNLLNLTISGTGSVGTRYGLYYTGSGTATTDWFIYQDLAAASRFNHNVIIETNSYGLVLGASRGVSALYDGTHTFFRNLAGSGEFVFDSFTTVTQDAVVNIKAGNDKDAVLRLTADKGDDNADNFRMRHEASTNNILFETYATGAWTTALKIDSSKHIHIPNMRSGATQAGAGAALGELWRTNGHATLPDGVVMCGL
jgi:hypothetical protein